MALSESDFQRFRSGLIKASKDLTSCELVYQTEWIFDLPTASLKIGGTFLDASFDIPIGLTGYGEGDLDRLVKEGILLKVDESEEDPVTWEKRVTYKILV